MTKISNNDAWNTIFEDLCILEKLKTQDSFDISADEIKKRDGKEARLMTKVDHKEHLPTIMRTHDLSILAIQNGLYKIAKTDPFIDIQKEPLCEITRIEPPKHITSIDPLNIKSESGALDIAKISGMLDRVFGEPTELTIRGRLRGDLDFSLQGVAYKVKGVQIEVDGGYEGKNGLYLIEAKMGFRNNINVRQLLYPELFWRKQLTAKEILSYLFYYQDDIFRFIPIVYDGTTIFADHQREKAFRFSRQSQFKLSQLLAAPKIQVNDAIPFPQADDFEKIHTIFFNLGNHESQNKEDLIGQFDLVPRQYDYYLNALRWMDLCSIEQGCVSLTPKGQQLLSLDIQQRMQAFASIIFSEPICFCELKKIAQDQHNFARYNMSGSTVERRLQTIRSWIKYFNHFFDGSRSLWDE